MYKTPRGTQDILPAEQAYWRFIDQQASILCQRYGYQRIDTPVFEESGLFYRSIGAGTDIVDKEMYTFEDRSGTKMTLRPEGTAPVCRAYIEHGMHNLPQPVRLYYFAPIFRYERPQAGRYRQHYQFGVEALGDADPSLDAEVIDLAWQFLASLGMKMLVLQVNNIGCKLCRGDYLPRLKQYYSMHSEALCPNCQVRLERSPLRLLDCKNPSCQQIAQNAPKIIDHLCPQCDSHFKQVKGYLAYLEIPLEINPYLVRGLDYYSSTVFEIQPEGGGAQSTIGGGGRYDNLIEELAGRATPAVGFAAGIERIILNMQKQGIEPPPIPQPKVYVAYLGEEGSREAVKLVARLRRAGLGAIKAPGGRSLKAQLKQANSLGAAQVVIIGEEEAKRGSIILRDMEKGDQKEIPQQKAVTLLRDFYV